MSDLKANYRDYNFVFQTGVVSARGELVLNSGLIYIKPSKEPFAILDRIIEIITEVGMDNIATTPRPPAWCQWIYLHSLWFVIPLKDQFRINCTMRTVSCLVVAAPRTLQRSTRFNTENSFVGARIEQAILRAMILLPEPAPWCFRCTCMENLAYSKRVWKLRLGGQICTQCTTLAVQLGGNQPKWPSMGSGFWTKTIGASSKMAAGNWQQPKSTESQQSVSIQGHTML